jgi:2-isopropylmalate synthase
MQKKVFILDSTLRDGAQGEGISFSIEDKLNIVSALDRIGVSYIEAGNPGSNPKDIEFFRRISGIKLKNSVLAAFGSTRRKDTAVDRDPTLASMLSAGTETVVIFGKSWDLHVTDVLHTTPDENLRMIEESVRYLREHGREVIYDAEHFFDGYKANPDYAMMTLRAACRGGASCTVLCDTNGGCFPSEIKDITSAVIGEIDTMVGIHCHNDTGCAVANSISAVEAGARHVQGTFLGFGERCGNANLSTIIPNLQLKLGYKCLPDPSMAQLTSTARYIAEISNIPVLGYEPYVGNSAFAHKAGMHADGVSKVSRSFEHVDPEVVGNHRRFLISEMAGRTSIMQKLKTVCPDLCKDSPETRAIIEKLKELEYQGYQFDAAETSFELVVMRQLRRYHPFFELVNFRIIGEKPVSEGYNSSATIKIRVGDKEEITAAEGEGPIHALDRALRKALEVFYPELRKSRLSDYKVRVLDPQQATAAKVRVLITSTDGEDVWSTVGVSTDIIEASWIALVDSIEYKLLKSRNKQSEFTEGGSEYGDDDVPENTLRPRGA